jgi:beta-galactosidase
MSSQPRLSRRNLLKTIAIAASATCIPATPGTCLAAETTPPPFPEHGTLVPDDGWSLWLDTHAAWESDDIFLPDEVAWIGGTLCGKGKPLPVNTPTGGWSALQMHSSTSILLPTSVEQHFWGRFGAGTDGKPRPYTPQEYRYAATTPPVPPADDNVPQNGAYFGVSWFFRHIQIPPVAPGPRVFLHIRGAHLRAEVYLNGKLCGYSIMEELPFEADLSAALAADANNLLAIRITNPFGRFDWVDGNNAKWGKVNLYRSHGFGALDRGMTIRVEGDVRISDLWTLNTPTPTTIVTHLDLQGTGVPALLKTGTITCKVVDAQTSKILTTIHRSLAELTPPEDPNHSPSSPNTTTTPVRLSSLNISTPRATLWDLDQPKLYHLVVECRDDDGKLSATRTTVFGFRSFTTAGIGTRAMFRLNGRRIRLYSSISWGFWGLNGMFPIPELAEKEVRAAQALGLNCLNFHRNLAKEDVLRKHDELGLLRYMEPGAGKLAIGRLPPNVAPNSAGIVMEKPGNDADIFAQRYMFLKCVAMVKAFRSHVSVIEYCLQNEIGADLKNPATIAVLEAMHREDPSRIVVLNDGFVARGAAQAWYEAWSMDNATGTLTPGKLHRSDEEKWGSFWNNHQGAGDQWYDQFYKSPTEFTYKAPFANVLTEFGEMEGCARPDNHALMLHQIQKTFAAYGGNSYDLVDHQQILSAYDRFLDRWNFRSAFPTSESLFKAVGRTCYETWMNYMENARISDDLDFAVISGWESTAIENHSGIVDNLRNFKSDPELIRGSLLPVRPIAKQRSFVTELNKPATFDLYLANDTPQPATGSLTFTMITPSNTRHELITLTSPTQQPDVFSYLLHEAFATPPLTQEGLYRFKWSLSSAPLATQTKDIWVTGLPKTAGRKLLDIAVSGLKPETHAHLDILGRTLGCFRFVDFKQGETYAAIISAGITAKSRDDAAIGETTGEQMPVAKPGRAPEPGESAETVQLGSFAPGVLEAVRNGAALLAIPQSDTLSEGLARQLAAAGAFSYEGTVGDFRAPWMGNWYFVREHALFAGLPTNCALGAFYQTPGRQSNGLRIEQPKDGPAIEIIVGYSRDHDRHLGAGTFTTTLGKGKLVFHRVPPMLAIMEQRFLANTLLWLTA